MPTARPGNAIYADGPAWLALVARVAYVEKVLDTSALTINRTERALMGGWDESGTRWIDGLRDSVQHVDAKMDAFKVQSEEDLTTLRAEMKAARRTFNGILSGVWLLAVAAVSELLNSYFGWFGAAHAALHR